MALCEDQSSSHSVEVSDKPKSMKVLSKGGCTVSGSRSSLLSAVFFHVRVHYKIAGWPFNELHCPLLVR